MADYEVAATTRAKVAADQAKFFTARGPRLLAFAQGLLSRYEVPSGRLEAQDVVQHTVAEILERWQEVRQPERYMFTVARHHVMRAVREGARFTGNPAVGLGQSDGIDLDGLDPARQIWGPHAPALVVDEYVAIHVDVARALTELSGQQQRAVELSVMQGRSRADTAAAMNVSVNAVSSHRDRALKILKRVLGGTLAIVVIVFGPAGAARLWWWLGSSGPQDTPQGTSALSWVVPLCVAAAAALSGVVASFSNKQARRRTTWSHLKVRGDDPREVAVERPRADR